MKTILVADDEDFFRLLVRYCLEEHRIVEARRGCDALVMAKDLAPDLVLLDWMMPEMDGPEVLEALRADEATCDLPIVMVTGRVSREDHQRLLECGASACLCKPFTPRQLRECVEGLLESD